MHPLHDIALIDALGADLRSAGYTGPGVAAFLGEDAEEALGRGIWWPALHATKQAGPSRLGTLVRLLLLACDESVREVAEALPGCLIDDLVANEVITVDGLTARAALDIRPHADGVWMLYRSPVIKMGIGLMNAFTGDLIRGFTDPEEFDAELARVIREARLADARAEPRAH